MEPQEVQDSRSGRARRVVAFLLSLVQPGAGHILLGSVRRGIAWAVGLAALGLLFLLTMPISLPMIALGILVGFLARVAVAVDTLRLPARRAPWWIVMGLWVALFVGSVAVDRVAKPYYTTHYAQSFTVPSGAMEPALLLGDYVLSDNAVYRHRDPQRGDIIVFKYPKDERRTFVKRVIAVRGDTVEIRDERVYINGSVLDEPYLPGGLKSRSGRCGFQYGCESISVPRGSVFVMGDNRDNSQDSRHWGLVSREKIVGRVFAIYFSWDGDRHWGRFDRIGRSL